MRARCHSHGVARVGPQADPCAGTDDDGVDDFVRHPFVDSAVACRDRDAGRAAPMLLVPARQSHGRLRAASGGNSAKMGTTLATGKDLETFNVAIRADVEAVRREVKQDVALPQRDLGAEYLLLRYELETHLAEHRQELAQAIGGLRDEWGPWWWSR